MRKGEKGEVCYFIKEGVVRCSKIGETEMGRTDLVAGAYFGERALLKDEPRTADVTALTDVVLMALDRNSFTELLGPLRNVMDSNMKGRVMDSLPIIQQLPKSIREIVMSKFVVKSFEEGEEIVRQGEIGDSFFVVREGGVVVLENNKELARLKQGDWFGEMSLINHEARMATCVADTSTTHDKLGGNASLNKVECFCAQ